MKSLTKSSTSRSIQRKRLSQRRVLANKETEDNECDAMSQWQVRENGESQNGKENNDNVWWRFLTFRSLLSNWFRNDRETEKERSRNHKSISNVETIVEVMLIFDVYM